MSGSAPAKQATIVWLASYPKSGNTWLRALFTACATGTHLFQLDNLTYGRQPHHTAAARPLWNLDTRWCSEAELATVRQTLVSGGGKTGLDLRKTHETYRPHIGTALAFPNTKAAVYVVRDPRDVAASWAPFFGLTTQAAVDRICVGPPKSRWSAANMTTSQPWGTWSEHVESWLGAQLEFPVHVVRYEDLAANTSQTMADLCAALNIDIARETIESAVSRTAFDKLAQDEEQTGFRERAKKADKFFRRGQVGAGREELSAEQLDRISSTHQEWMRKLGYLPDEAGPR